MVIKMKVIKARKKPIVIEAIQFFNGNGKNTINDCMGFIGGHAYYNEDEDELIIQMLEGTMVVSDGDYVIKGVNGEYYPCKPDIFEKTYNILEDE